MRYAQALGRGDETNCVVSRNRHNCEPAAGDLSTYAAGVCC
jgi:hypothetical protein